MTSSALILNDLEVRFYENDFKLSDINLEIKTGTITGLIGRNGAGKTTLLKAIMGLQKYQKGTITYFETDKSLKNPLIKERLSFTSNALAYNPRFSPDQIANAVAPFYKNFKYDLLEKYLDLFHLNEDQRLANFSTGMQRKFQVLLTISCNPDLLILDEPTANLDTVSKDDILDMVMDFMQDEEKSILFSTNLTVDVERIADYVVFMEKGKIIFAEEKDTLLEQYQLFHCPTECMTPEFKKNIVGMKETAFGYEGLISSSHSDIAGTNTDEIRFVRAGFDDFMRYFSEEGA